MTSVVDFMESLNRSKENFEALTKANKLAEIAKTYSSWKPIGNIEAIVEGLRLYQNNHENLLFDNSHLLSQAAIAVRKLQSPFASALADIHQSSIPFSLSSSIYAIGLHQAKLFNNISSISALFNNASLFIQRSGIQAAMLGVSERIAEIVAASKRWDILKDFEEITEEAAAISDRVVEKEYASKDDLEAIKAFMGRIELKINKKEKNVAAIILNLMAIIGFILALISEARNWIPKPEAATQQDIAILKKEILQQVETKIGEIKTPTITNRPCSVFISPKAKSRVITKLPAGLRVMIFQKRHAWVYVTYVNPLEGLAESGWVLKKYVQEVKK
jgi:hypothetical protein